MGDAPIGRLSAAAMRQPLNQVRGNKGPKGQVGRRYYWTEVG